MPRLKVYEAFAFGAFDPQGGKANGLEAGAPRTADLRSTPGGKTNRAGASLGKGTRAVLTEMWRAFAVNTMNCPPSALGVFGTEAANFPEKSVNYCHPAKLWRNE